jgi:hypothetical protein
MHREIDQFLHSFQTALKQQNYDQAAHMFSLPALVSTPLGNEALEHRNELAELLEDIDTAWRQAGSNNFDLHSWTATPHVNNVYYVRALWRLNTDGLEIEHGYTLTESNGQYKISHLISLDGPEKLFDALHSEMADA